MAVKRKDRKMKIIEEDDAESGLKLHKTNCDMLYRWSMWRMYLNEELSRVISARRDHLDQSNSIYSVTSPYIKHPDGKKYGNKMKRMFGRDANESHSMDILSDNAYLVYGLPRVSLRRPVPDEVQQLHESLHELELQYKRERESDASVEADEQISKLFDFVTSDEINYDNQVSVRRLGQKKDRPDGANSTENKLNAVTRTSDTNQTKENIETSQDASKNTTTNDTDKSELYKTKSEKDIPLASKSRLFWERLADKKTDIIELGKQKHEAKENQEHNVISSEILQKQQKLLKKTVPKRTSKDLWRTLRERKTEILQMRQMAADSSHKSEQHDNHNANHERKHESKTSQLWGFIFHKKKELAHMKRGRRVSHDMSKLPVGRKLSHSGPSDAKPNISPRNFEDSFQKELAERLRKRRIHLEPASSSDQ